MENLQQTAQQTTQQKSAAQVREFLFRRCLPVLLALFAGGVAWYQQEIADLATHAEIAAQLPVFAALNTLTAFCLTLLLYALIGRWSTATTISGVFFLVLAIAGYYTLDLHGTVLMPQDILNLGTAFEVLGSYKITIPFRVVKIVLLFALVLAAAFVQKRLEKPLRAKKITWRQRGARVLVSAGCCAAILYFGYFSPRPVKPANTFTWAWQLSYHKYGYLACTVESTTLLSNCVVEPDGYTDESAQQAAASAAGYTRTAAEVPAGEYPDIVLILSETFYDPALVTDLKTDVPYMSVTQNLPNAIYGHTVSPHVGGGTNATEYEMLTSNSLSLMPAVTPFNWLNLNGANSLVSYLEGMGYSSLAAHPYIKTNYRRDTAWNSLGFDETHFAEDFPTQQTYGARPYQMDSATYQDFESLYENMPSDSPRFAFLVSIQSHGDYAMNDASMDLVHAAADYGEYDSQMDEFLTCMYQSDQAFGELTQYFTRQYEKTGRKVIVAMAGDHAPSFIKDVADAGQDENALQILERSTPCILWANYPLENAGAASAADPLNRMDMCELGPTLVEQAGLPLSPFYQYLLAMKQNTPVFTAANDYMDAAGALQLFGVNAENDAWVQGYFALAYNNIGSRAKQDETLFVPQQ